jgi:pilus assembly protein CpaE
MAEIQQLPDSPGGGALFVALIGPDEQRRKAVVAALSGRRGVVVREFSAFPADLETLPRMLEHHYDAVIVDLDSDPDYAFDLAENISAAGRTSVMGYSAHADLELAIRFMRAGVREFLTLPIAPAEISGALARVSMRHAATRTVPKSTSAGQLFVFLGAKGGCGVTTIASNFAVSLAQETGQSTLLIDLGVPLGDAAINLGMVTEYSVANALHDFDRLDGSFLSTLLARHSSGLQVLAAPGEFPPDQPSREAIDKLLSVAQKSFDYVVADAGSRVDLMATALFAEASTIYLVTQVGITELRNSNRMIAQFFATRGRSLQIVLNRYAAHSLLFDDAQITKALTRPAQWKIPDDFATARRTRNTAKPLALEDSAISLAIRQMARAACGLPAAEEKNSGFFGFFRRSQ